ncbi:MAG: CvpA family protein [Ponticaulis sp.]|nr:CvpA family protein [Ponticaulis sp.]|tara:strand:+ start:53616 stop:54173 length:558 start_codon:yes stop_codon:yes gene_type:complete
MSEFLSSNAFTAFDAVVAVLMVFSGLMAFARGFIREVASIAAFIAAIIAAIFAYIYIGPFARDMVPESWSPLIPNGIVIALAFLIIYIVAAWFGRKFSKFVHATTDISLLDRLAGLVFGFFRAGMVIVLILFVFRPVIEDAQLSWIVDSFSYPYFQDAVIWVQSILPDVQQGVQDVLPDNLNDSP